MEMTMPMPSVAEQSDVSIATSQKDVVWTRDKVRLFRFRPTTEQKVHTPVLISYGLIGRWTMIDLQKNRSLVRNLLDAGVSVYVVDWGNPDRAESYLTLDDYILGYLDECVDQIRAMESVNKINLFGVCEGGVFALALAALEPQKFNSLTLAITPLDFHADKDVCSGGNGLLNVWIRSLSAEDVDRYIDAHGNLPGLFMGSVFTMLTPVKSMIKYNIDLAGIISDKEKLNNWLRMEKWISDRPDHPGEAARQWLKDMYQDNLLIRSEWHLDGRRVDLKNITMPVLNIYAQNDHIVPPSTTCVLRDNIGTSSYEELPLPGGHVGIFVGSRAQKLFGSSVVAFLTKVDQ